MSLQTGKSPAEGGEVVFVVDGVLPDAFPVVVSEAAVADTGDTVTVSHWFLLLWNPH